MKYEEIFGERMNTFDDHLAKYLKKEDYKMIMENDSFMNLDINSIQQYLKLDSLIKEGEDELKIQVSPFYLNDFTRSSTMFNSYDKSNVMVIKFMCNNGYFRERMGNRCKKCNCTLSREHVVNDCTTLDKARNSFRMGVQKLLFSERDLLNSLSLHDKILKLYYNPDLIGGKLRNRIWNLLKKFVLEIYSIDRITCVEWGYKTE